MNFNCKIMLWLYLRQHTRVHNHPLTSSVSPSPSPSSSTAFPVPSDIISFTIEQNLKHVKTHNRGTDVTIVASSRPAGAHDAMKKART